MKHNTNLHMWIECEIEPLCVESTQPEFSWYWESAAREIEQRAYQVRVSSLKGESYWDSGVVKTKTQSILYAGDLIPPETTCVARLTVWDSAGECYETCQEFRTGLFAECFEDEPWCGAKWIGTGTRNLWAPMLTVFDLSCEITLLPGSEMAGIIFGANDPRLMDRYKNIWGLESMRFGSYLYVRIDTRPLSLRENARLEIFRVGYAKSDSREKPLFSLEIPRAVLCEENRFERHLVRVQSVYGEADLFLDGIQLNCLPAEAPIWMGAGLNLNPAGQGGNYTAFPALCDIGWKLEPGQEAIFQNLTIRNIRKPANVLGSFWREGKVASGRENGSFCVFDPSRGGIPMLRRDFYAEAISRAYLTITARGCYEAYINGEKVGKDFLAPGLTHYHRTHMYQVYDVTGQLQDGDNAIAVELGEGWWSGAITFKGEFWNFWGDVQSVLLKLTLEHTDGTVTTIVSSPDTFTASNEGVIRYGSLFQGEVWDLWFADASAGWKNPGFSGGWKPAIEIPLSSETAVLGEVPSMKEGTISLSYDQQRVMGQIGNGVRCCETFTAKSVQEVRPGVYIYDLGQNIAGVPEIQMPGGCPGQEVTIRYGEILYPMLPEYGDNQGMLMVENLRAAHATDVIYLGEEPTSFAPRFTFHGFRYLEITGVDQPIPIEQVKARALSSVETLTADFTCSDERINRLFRNITWSLRDNFLSIPTDCPQRNERMGWSGDLSVFSQTAVYLSDANAFLRRHMLAMENLQTEEGAFPDIAPVSNGFGGILWGSAGIVVPWEAYCHYGDRKILETHYDAMARYITFLRSHEDPNTGLQMAGELGDWLGPQVMKTENSLLWTAYYVYDLGLMANIAEALGKPEAAEYRAHYLQSRHRFNEIFFDSETHRTVYSGESAARGNRMPFQPVDYSKPLPPKEPGGGYLMDTQTSYCVPLALGLVEEDYLKPVQDHLSAFCRRENADDDGILRPAYSLMTGFVGTAWLLPALSDAGQDDIAYQILENEAYPSWLYPVKQGATTIWERLDSYTVEKGFGGHNSMNSFNHYAFGAVGQWLMANCLGISGQAPCFTTFCMQPTPDPTGHMTWAQGWCDTKMGRVTSRWEITPEGTHYQITVPAGSTCMLELPGERDAVVIESGKAIDEAESITVLGWNKTHRFRVKSGSYHFQVSKAAK